MEWVRESIALLAANRIFSFVDPAWGVTERVSGGVNILVGILQALRTLSPVSLHPTSYILHPKQLTLRIHHQKVL
jgi:hypothetical protein